MVFDIRVRLGAVMHIRPADRVNPADGPVTLRVTGVRLVANQRQDYGRVWLEGFRLTEDGGPGRQTQILVRADLLPP
ncbi:hypothetical protein [Micromonospora echinofusca]|uniref:hypothetical protein n=2 Tax=Micromonospora TaxID=1873 RepID=UPI0027DD9601|nr:hypothetical protein [Micromonospora echinofusca]